MKRHSTLLVLAALLLGVHLAGVAQAGTRDEVLARGRLVCGVSDLPVGAVVAAVDGGFSGFFGDFCRAVAVALLGDAEAVEFVPLTPRSRFQALVAGEVDLLVGAITITAERDTRLGINFGPPVFFDAGQPFAPAVREGDDDWLDLVSWVIYALIQAEEWELSAAEIAAISPDEDPPAPLARFLGFEAGVTERLGLAPDALRRVIVTLGNYGEIFDRHLGPHATVSLPRGRNRPALQGGLLYAPPFSPR